MGFHCFGYYFLDLMMTEARSCLTRPAREPVTAPRRPPHDERHAESPHTKASRRQGSQTEDQIRIVRKTLLATAHLKWGVAGSIEGPAGPAAGSLAWSTSIILSAVDLDQAQPESVASGTVFRSLQRVTRTTCLSLTKANFVTH